MNVLQLIPKLNVGGVERGAIEVARYLTLNGHKAVVVSGGGILEKNIAAMGARHYTLPIGHKNPFVMLFCYFKLIDIIKKENIGLVHARSRIPALVGYFAALSTKRIFLTTAHGQYKRHLISRVMGWGKLVIVANETMARHMKDNFETPIRKMRVIPRGVDLKRFSYISPKEKHDKKFRIGMICRFTPLKGHLDFLKAASYVTRKKQDVEIVLMGDKASAKEEYISKIGLTIRRLLLDKFVRFVDSDKKVPDILKELNILVSANREQEAFGRSIIEAQSRGVPVVATKIGGVIENVKDGVTGLLCEPMDPSDMSKKILRYMEDPDLCERVSLSARKYVEEHYSLEYTMKKTLEVYFEAINLKNILVFKISSLGDVILCIPSLRAIRKRFPLATIKVLIDIRFREILDRCPYIDETITCDLAGRDRGMEFIKLAGRLRAEDFDISIDLQNNRKSHMLAFLSRITERYGYDNGKLSLLLNRKITPPGMPMGPIEHQSCVLGLLGITNVENSLELWTKEEDDIWAQKFMEERWLKKDQKLVAISLSASRKWDTKNWGVSHAAELADMLASRCGIRVVIIGTEEDKDVADSFMKRTVAKPINAVGKTDISRLISLIKRCNALLTGDSAPMHIASSMGTPFVAIFGPTDPMRHIGPSDRHKVLRKDTKCAPCYSTTCSKNKKCMQMIKPEEVFEALMEVMDGGARV
ncbi:MAG: lipopolysaccharide heptosyltransferase II [Candidatus Omnitrophota bacterium]